MNAVSAEALFLRRREDISRTIFVVMCACNSKEMYQVRKSVKDTDPDSFIVVVESHEVHGEGFKMTNIGEAEN